MAKILLRNGLIVDGTGTKGYTGDVLLEDGKILAVSKTPIQAEAEVVDCTGKAIAPGFIDAHSHQDWYIASEKDVTYFEPFLRQGVTTMVGGNCGSGVAGLKRNSPFRAEVLGGLHKSGVESVKEGVEWYSWKEYADYMTSRGMLVNLANFAPHGAAMASIVGRVPKQNGMEPGDKKELMELLQQSLDEGCKGVSLGLAYRPDSFMTDGEIHEVAELVAKNNGILAVHRKVDACVSQEYDTYDVPHNVRCMQDFVDLVKDTGVKVQFSHVIYPGRKTWTSYDAVMDVIDGAEKQGVDLWFDMYSYPFGATEIAIILPGDFPRMVPEVYTNPELIEKVKQASTAVGKAVGIYPSDMQLADPRVPELAQYKGMFLDEVAEKMGKDNVEARIEIYRLTNGHALMYLHSYYSEEHIQKQMTHPKVLYMTDAWVAPGCQQNPAAFGSMVRFLRIARETGNLSMEETVAHMTGMTADRFSLNKRGYLREGYFADIVVFDPETVAETATARVSDTYPVGIDHVFLNGEHVLKGDAFTPIRAGAVV